MGLCEIVRSYRVSCAPYITGLFVLHPIRTEFIDLFFQFTHLWVSQTVSYFMIVHTETSSFAEQQTRICQLKLLYWLTRFFFILYFHAGYYT